MEKESLEEEIIHRLKNAVIAMEGGGTMQVGGLTLASKDKFHLSVIGGQIMPLKSLLKILHWLNWKKPKTYSKE